MICDRSHDIILLTSTDKVRGFVMERNLMFCSLGNGVSVCDTLHEENGDYVNVAHINRHRRVTFYKRLNEDDKNKIVSFAKTEHPNISASQDQKIFLPEPK